MAFIVCITLQIHCLQVALRKVAEDWHRDTGLSHKTVPGHVCISDGFLPACISDMFCHQVKIFEVFFFNCKSKHCVFAMFSSAVSYP